MCLEERTLFTWLQEIAGISFKSENAYHHDTIMAELGRILAVEWEFAAGDVRSSTSLSNGASKAASGRKLSVSRRNTSGSSVETTRPQRIWVDHLPEFFPQTLAMAARKVAVMAAGTVLVALILVGVQSSSTRAAFAE